MPDIRPLMMVLSSKGSQGQGRGRVWIGISIVALLLGGLGFTPPSSAAEFSCAAGDVACLIDAITTANANGEANTITLEAGTYALTAATDFSNGLPSVTSTLTITGADAETTIIERAAGNLRLMHVATTGTLILKELTLRGGATPGRGCGIFNMGTAIITHSTLADNHSCFDGGAIFNGGTMTLTNSTLTHNGIDDGVGGGIDNEGTLTIENSTLSHNGGAVIGGGIFNAGTMTLTNSTLAFNHAFAGGGIGGVGGNIMTLTNCTLAFNGGAGAMVGGGINGGPVTLQNTILALNTSELAPNCSGPVTSLGNNLIGDPTRCTITLQGTDLTGDPGLDAFTDDGTPGNGHFPLLPTSPAIDAGNDAACPDTDQLGQPRVLVDPSHRAVCDIGAIEFQLNTF